MLPPRVHHLGEADGSTLPAEQTATAALQEPLAATCNFQAHCSILALLPGIAMPARGPPSHRTLSRAAPICASWLLRPTAAILP